MASLEFVERPPTADPVGLLMLHHGRGADEYDLLPLADVLDPEHRWHVVSPRAPLQFRGSPGFHWYVVSRVGYPDPETFAVGFDALAALHDELWQRTGMGPERTVLGGFSQGTVMSYATGLAGERPAVSGLLAFSGFVPTVSGWQPSLADRARTRVLISHGRLDPVISVEFARRARELLEDAGLPVSYQESEAGHHIDPRQLPAAGEWLATLAAQ